MNLTKEHCAKVLNDWAAYHVKKAEERWTRAEGNLREANIELRIAQAVEEERKKADPYYGVGWGESSVDQLYAETKKRVEAEFSEACRVLQNNKDMQEYVASITT